MATRLSDEKKKNVGKRIKAIRETKGLTLEEFGKRFDASKSIVSRWENGISVPNNKRLADIAEYGGQSVDWLLYGLKLDESIAWYTNLSEIPTHLKAGYKLQGELDEMLNFHDLTPSRRKTLEQYYKYVDFANDILSELKDN